MTCTFINVPGGGQAIICTRGSKSRNARCGTCKAAANDYLCDGCDAPVCKAHVFSPSRQLDYCPACTTPVKRWWLENDGATFRTQPKSALLMRFIEWARFNPTKFPRSKASKEDVP